MLYGHIDIYNGFRYPNRYSVRVSLRLDPGAIAHPRGTSNWSISSDTTLTLLAHKVIGVADQTPECCLVHEI
jgi:hypothetical protein